jgi:hypothetical protein
MRTHQKRPFDDTCVQKPDCRKRLTCHVLVVSSPGSTRSCSARRLPAQIKAAPPKAASRRKALGKVVEVVRHRRKRRVLIPALLSLLATVALEPPLLSEVTPLHIALLSLTAPLLSVGVLLPVAAILPLTQGRSISGRLLSLLTTDLITCALEPRLLFVVTLLSPVGAPTLLPLTQSRPIAAGLLSLLTTDLVACALEPRLLSVVNLLPKATLATR